MCRLFGFRSSVESKAHRSLVSARNALVEQAREHRDGWGIGYFRDRRPTVVRSVASADACDRFRQVSAELSSHTFLVHVRRATVGDVRPENLHPFAQERWIFAHNGTIHGVAAIRDRMLRSVPSGLGLRQAGTTDTELLFHYLLGALDRAGLDLSAESLPSQRLGDVCLDAVQQVCRWAAAADLPRPSLNFVLTNGAMFVGHRYGRELFFATQKLSCGERLTCPEPNKVCLLARRPINQVNHLIVASERIGDEDIWEELPDGGLVVLDAQFRVAVRAPATPHPTSPGPVLARQVSA